MVLEERRVISALFCDLVGFTAISESADPEDVDRMLTRYFAMARSAIESHGGVVEKFIGDAVLGVFGVPAAHEDDPLRAVRAGLQIVARAASLRTLAGTELRLRVGINTGEVLARLDVAPDSGQRFLAGDTVNTAARIQSVAPEMGVAVGETTWRATRSAVEFDELPSATLKGKAEPVRVFQAVALRSTPGLDPARVHGGKYVGRAEELGRLRDAFDRVAGERVARFVIVSGEPGIGKSRTIGELRRHVETTAPDVRWRQGRCLPYGDGVTFWALGEVVKAHAGILEGETPETARAKLEASLSETPDRDWLQARLLPILGIDSGAAVGREEAFAAWRSFLVSLAVAGPAVVVLEDLHWADDAFLEFYGDLASRSEAVPLLVVATTRHDLFVRKPALALMPRLELIDLAPLSNDETEALVADRLGTIVPAELRDPIVARAEGNPLFAEEYVRLLGDRGLLVEANGAVTVAPGATLPVPESIGALLAARLDTLERPRKALLSDASVVGHVFWTGTVAAIGGREPDSVASELADLARLEFVRRIEPSSMEGEDEAAFWHALGRDVAYAQLPRAARATRHLAAAAWLEAKAGDRVEDIAEVLAHHYTTALDLFEATGDTELATSVRPRAARLLRLAGDRALGLDAMTAVAAYERTLALLDLDDPARPEVLGEVGDARFQAGQSDAAVNAFEAALAGFEKRGDERRTALTLLDLARALSYVGPERPDLVDRAVALLEPSGPSRDLIEALTMRVWMEYITGRNVEALATALRASEMAAELGIGVPPRLLARRGSARAELGDRNGIDDLRAAIELATAAGQGREAAITHSFLASHLWLWNGPVAAIEALEAGMSFAQSRGLAGVRRLLAAELAGFLLDAGELDRAEAMATDTLHQLEAAGDVTVLEEPELVLARLAVLRGNRSSALAMQERLSKGDALIARLDKLAMRLRILADAGDHEAARRLLVDIADPSLTRSFIGMDLRDAIPAAVALDELDLANRLLDREVPPWPYVDHQIVSGRARILEAQGRLAEAVVAFADAAERWAVFGCMPDEADARLGLGRCLLALGRPDESIAPLERARKLYERMGAVPGVSQTTTFLSEVTRRQAADEAPPA